MEPYKISIILPCYKVAQYIERCINSILAQDFLDYEVIIIMMEARITYYKYVNNGKNYLILRFYLFPIKDYHKLGMKA